MENQKKTNNSVFERKIKPVLQYVGAIGATICMIAYIICVVVLIEGFDPNNSAEVEINIVFAVVTAILGFIIMQFLKIQGISFASNIPENIETIKEYYSTKVKKEKKLHSISYFWIFSVIKDIIMRCLTLVISTVSIVWIVIQGAKDWNLMLLAIVNLLLFTCFGLLALVKAYDFYNNQHINFIKEKIELGKTCKKQEEEFKSIEEPLKENLNLNSGDENVKIWKQGTEQYSGTSTEECK